MEYFKLLQAQLLGRLPDARPYAERDLRQGGAHGGEVLPGEVDLQLGRRLGSPSNLTAEVPFRLADEQCDVAQLEGLVVSGDAASDR